MLSIYSTRKIFLLIIILLTPMFVSAQDAPAFEFPEVDGWQKGDIVKYPRSEMGYSVNYESQTGGRITIYIYDGDIPKIPDGHDSKEVKKQIKQAEDEIRLMVEMGYYQSAKKVKSGVVTMGSADGKVKAQHSNFDIEAGGNKLTSDIYIFGYKNNFIKVRATRLKDGSGKENKAFISFLDEIDKFYSE